MTKEQGRCKNKCVYSVLVDIGILALVELHQQLIPRVLQLTQTTQTERVVPYCAPAHSDYTNRKGGTYIA